MPGDFSRNSVNRPKNYSGVLMQQGRVQVDADWNEQLALQHHRTSTEARDLIGNCGTPKSGNGFLVDLVPGGGDLVIEPGRFYVHGLLCELDPQRVAVTFPAAASGSPPTAQFKYRFTPKSGIPYHGAIPRWTDSQGQVNIPSLCLDDRNLCVGDWVELSAEGVKPLVTTVTAVGPNTAATDPNSITPNYYTLTLNSSVFAFQTAAVVWLRRVVTFTTQPFLHSQLDAALETANTSSPSGETLHLVDGDYLVTLEAWEREVDALEDPHIREVALGGPDTAERLQTAWQVHVVPYAPETTPSGSGQPSSPPSPLDCCTDFPGWDQYKSSLRTTGRMNAQAPPPGNNVQPCQLPPQAGYLGLANQLYRVEIFQSGEYNEGSTFVWSRDNAMVETTVVCVDSAGVVYVNDLGKDDLHSFSQNDWVEIFDRNDELLGSSRFLAQITNPTGGQVVPPCAAPGAPQSYNLTLTPAATQFSGRSNLRMRRWDMPASGTVAYNSGGSAVGIPIVPGWIQLESNIYVNFTDGYYAVRSYWQIPARTATGDIEWPPYQVPNTNPIPQPPLGVSHYFCRLATLTVSGGSWMLADCRCRFPDLNNICADDVCYQGDGCELEAVNNVQQAIEELGARLRYHNKTLHGSGVVCGLGVTCSTGATVQVKEGYAIDCEGYDLILKNKTYVDFSSLIELSPSQVSIPDGDYELLLERSSAAKGSDRGKRTAGSPAVEADEECCAKSGSNTGSAVSCVSFRAIPCEPETTTNEILRGTLLFDFYNKCLKGFIEAFRTEYLNSYASAYKQVTEAQALTSSLTNLIVQLAQPSLTSDVFISQQEHVVLERFYNWLTGQLQHDCTFCELKDVAPFPAYNVASQMTTIFGKGFSTRLRIDPTGARAYGVGSDNNIYLYDLNNNELASMTMLPSPANADGWVVQDVAFNNTGTQIYAIATTSGNSLFAIGTIDATKISWTSSRSLGALSFTTLASVAENLYGVAAGQGLYSIALNSSGTGVTQIQGLGTPVGHLVAAGELLYLTANSGSGTAGGSFDQVQMVEANQARLKYALPAGASGNLTDDLLADGENIWVTGTASGARQLFEYGNAATKPSSTVPLNDNTTVRLAYDALFKAPLISFEDTCRVQRLSDAAPLSISAYCPTEVNPNSIVVAVASNNRGKVYVLNSTSNTVSVIPANMAAFTDFADLESYRNAALDAFIQIFGALLESFKDCFCNLFVVGCPECDGESSQSTGVSLACVTFQNGSVFRICNLEKRHYVKSFPTVGYWLSLIPVIPLARTLIRKFCCMALPSLFSKYTAPGHNATYDLALDPNSTRRSIAQLQNFKLSDAVTSVASKIAPVPGFAGDAVLSPFRASAASGAVAMHQVIGQPLATAQQTLANSNISVVAVTSYDPTQFARNVASSTTAPQALPTGSSVTLVTDQSGNVKYYIPSAPAVTTINTAVQSIQKAETPVAASLTGLQTLVNTLQTQIGNMQVANAQALAQRDQEIASLTVQMKNLSSRLPPPAPAKP